MKRPFFITSSRASSLLKEFKQLLFSLVNFHGQHTIKPSQGYRCVAQLSGASI